VRRVDKTREDLNKPPAPVLPGQPIEALGPTVGQNLIFALNDLTGAQNNLMSVVLNYYESRMLLYRTLGILELDNCGMWIERPIEEAEWLTEDQCPLPPNVPVDWLEDAEIEPRELHQHSSEDADVQAQHAGGVGAAQFADVLTPVGQMDGEAAAAPTNREAVVRAGAIEPKGVGASHAGEPKRAARRRVRRDELRAPSATASDTQDAWNDVPATLPLETPGAPGGGGRGIPAILPQ
jgi:hypothetical protein